MPDFARRWGVVITEGHLFGGRVLYRQLAIGFRSGIEPVFLAASVPAQPGEHVLEAGTGAGAALLCLTARCPGILATGVEIDEPTANLAAANVRANGLSGIEIITSRIEVAVFDHLFDHAIANPPYHSPDGTVSPVGARDTAKRGSVALIAAWVERLSRVLRDRGTLTLIVPAGMIPACMSAMTENHCPCTAIFPLWPKLGRSAKLVLLRGGKNARSPMRLMQGLILHEPDGSFTALARAILDGDAELALV